MTKKISNIINSIKNIIKLKDPTNIVLEKWRRPNGLNISKDINPYWYYRGNL